MSMSPTQVRAWRRELETLLLEGTNAAALDRIKALLSPYRMPDPDQWIHRPCVLRGRPKSRLPGWTVLLANPSAVDGWGRCALAALVEAGVNPNDVHANPALWRTLMDHSVDQHIHPKGLALLVPYLQALAPGRPEREKAALEWLETTMAVCMNWTPPDAVQVVVGAVCAQVPQVLRGDPARRLWVAGLGLNRLVEPPGGPRVLRAMAAYEGLESTLILRWQDIPAVCRKQWGAGAERGPWQDAPAWVWALDQGVFLGTRMVLKRAQETQPSPWSPNAPGPSPAVGWAQWLLERALGAATRPREQAIDRVRELEVLGTDWLAGRPGERLFDLLSAAGVGEEALSSARWDELSRQAAAAVLEERWTTPSRRQAARPRM